MPNPVAVLRDACVHKLSEAQVYDDVIKQSATIPMRPDAKLQVIGAGHSRSATLSLYVALMTLGLKTYHGMELVNGPEHPQVSRKWINVLKTDLAQGSTAGIDFKDVVKGYEAGCDNPFAEYWLELSRAFPDAKVIYTHRDAQAWYNSFQDTLVKPMVDNMWYRLAIFWFPNLRTINKVIILLLKKYQRDSGGLRPELMEERLADIRKEIPPEKLLVFHPREGWEPLCRFLGKPIPDVPFPKVNDGPSLQWVLTTVTIVGCGLWATTLAIGVGSIAWLMK